MSLSYSKYGIISYLQSVSIIGREGGDWLEWEFNILFLSKALIEVSDMF